MPSFKEACDILKIALADEIINDEEFVVLFELFTPANPEYPYWKYDKFRFENLDPYECKTELRFEKTNLPLLKQHLGVPHRFICS